MSNPPIKKGSKQRTAIINVLQSTTSHPTADWIYTEVRNIIPNISLGTVYRNLSALAEENEILKLDVGDGTDHFDGCCLPHYHMLCTGCKKVIDINLPYEPELNKKAEDIDDIQVERHDLIFYGLCPECKKKNN